MATDKLGSFNRRIRKLKREVKALIRQAKKIGCRCKEWTGFLSKRHFSQWRDDQQYSSGACRQKDEKKAKP
jgi:hypothetical protein